MSPTSLSAALDISDLAPVGLAAVTERAALQQRVDRKYLCSLEVAREMVHRLADSHHVLAIDGRTSTTYRTTYLDTPHLHCCRQHLQGQRRRWKARTRLYVEDELCRLEVKLKAGRGDTVKSSLDIDPARYGAGGTDAEEFVRETLAAHGVTAPAAFGPTLEVTYERVTLADLGGGTRVTMDAGLVARPTRGDGGLPRGRSVRLDEGSVIVETKGQVRAAPADRALVSLGVRPMSFSKYVACASLLSPRLADNQVRRHLGRELHTCDDTVKEHS